MAKRFPEYNSPLNLSETNKEILKIWDAHNLFESSIRERED